MKDKWTAKTTSSVIALVATVLFVFDHDIHRCIFLMLCSIQIILHHMVKDNK